MTIPLNPYMIPLFHNTPSTEPVQLCSVPKTVFSPTIWFYEILWRVRRENTAFLWTKLFQNAFTIITKNNFKHCFSIFTSHYAGLKQNYRSLGAQCRVHFQCNYVSVGVSIQSVCRFSLTSTDEVVPEWHLMQHSEISRSVSKKPGLGAQWFKPFTSLRDTYFKCQEWFLFSNP
jgi:hypothetical protein